MGNDNGVGLSPTPWLPSGSPTIPLPSARLMPPTPALEFPPISADLNLGIPSPPYPSGSIMSPSVTGMLMSAPPNPSRRNSLKTENTPTSSAVASNPLESFVDGAGGYDPPSTTPTPGPEKSSQNQQSQSLALSMPPPVSSAAIAAAVTATAPRPPPVPTSTSLKATQSIQQIQRQQATAARKNSLLGNSQLAQQAQYAKYSTSAALPATSAAIAAAGWVAGGPRRNGMGMLPSPATINPFGATGTTPAPVSMPMMATGLEAMSNAASMYASNAVSKDLVGVVPGKPLSPSEANAVVACKERAARVGDEFARKRKIQMEADSKRNPKRMKLEKRPEEMTKEELKKKSYAHRLYLNRQSAAVSRVRRQAYVKFLEESLSEIEQSKYRQQGQISALQDENTKLKAQMGQLQGNLVGGKGHSVGTGNFNAFGSSTQRSGRYSKRR